MRKDAPYSGNIRHSVSSPPKVLPHGIIVGNIGNDVHSGMGSLLAPNEQAQLNAGINVTTVGSHRIYQHENLHQQLELKDEYIDVIDEDNEDRTTLEALTKERLSMIDLSRIRRAMGSKYVGYDYPEIMGENEDGLLESSSVHSPGAFSTTINDTDKSTLRPMSSYERKVTNMLTSNVRPRTSGGILGSSAKSVRGNSSGGIRNQQSRTVSAGGAAFGDDATTGYSVSLNMSALSSAITAVEMDIEGSTPKAKHRYAQDVLLLGQLKAGVLPEQLIADGYNKETKSIEIDVSHYGLGDEHGKCLGLCFGKLDTLTKLCLTDNRLTSSSLPTILSNLGNCLLHLDLSQNDMHGHGSMALSYYFSKPTNLRNLNISASNLFDEDLRSICTSLMSERHKLEVFNLSHNKLTGKGMIIMGEYVTCETKTNGEQICTLTDLDLSWNELQVHGATYLAQAISVSGLKCVIKKLNLAANGLTDEGGQQIAASCMENTSLTNIDMAQNGLTGRTCFVFVRVSSIYIIKFRCNWSIYVDVKNSS